MQVRFYSLSMIFFVMAIGTISAPVAVNLPSLPSSVQTTSSVALTDAEIARMNAEASTAASQFSNQGLLGKIQTVAKAGVTAVTNPFMTIYQLVAPLGMFAYGFIEQAFQSICHTDYMGSELSILVDPKTQWSSLISAEKGAVKGIAGLGVVSPVSSTPATSATASATPASTGTASQTSSTSATSVKPATTATTTTPASASISTTATATTQPSASNGPTVQQLEDSGWVKAYAGGPVGIKFDFGFAGAGDDLTQPFGFLRSVSTGKYYYRPVRGQMTPAKMPVAGQVYSVDFHQRPFDVLVPKLLLSMLGKEIATPIWNQVLDFTQLDPVKIFVIKSMLLFSSAIKNSFQRVDTKTVAAKSATDQAQVYTKTSWSTYRSVDKGSAYPTLGNIQTEAIKLVKRLKVTPDIKRTIKANGGETLPSKWDPARIVYLGDINPGLILLSVLPDSLKILLNNLFSVNVNFYEFQSAIDAQNKLKPSDIELLYGFIRSCDRSADGIAQAMSAVDQGEYLDGYILKLQQIQERISTIAWAGGSQSFTDMMKLFFLLRWLLKDFYTGIEFIVSQYAQPSAALAAGQSTSAGATSPSTADAGGLQDQSVSTDVMLGDSYGRVIDFDLFAKKVLPGRVAALKKYASFVKAYINDFVAGSIGNSSIDARYVHMTPSKTLTDFSVALGGPDDLSTYFSPAMMKKTLSDYVSALSKEADAVTTTIDAEVASLNALITRAKDADDAYDEAAQASSHGSIDVPHTIENAMIATSDDLITELRKRANSAQDFGLYPLGYDEKFLKTVSLPGAVYLAYCLNFQMRLLSRPFEGDALYAYDDSFYDNDSAYMYLLSVLLRANEDLARAGAVVGSMSGPVTFKDANGKDYTVPNGAEFYLNSLKKYDQYYLLQEQNLRKVGDASGTSSDAYKKALVLYTNAQKLLAQKKGEMNNLLRTFEFDRRKGAASTPTSAAGATATALATKGQTVLVGGTSAAVASGAAGVGATNTGIVAVAPSSIVDPVVPVSAGVLKDPSADDIKAGIVGYLSDGTPVYSYERSVLSFLQAELAHFAFRSSMLDLDDLKELVFAVTGIKAEDLWAGVDAKKRVLFAEQQAVGKVSRAQSTAPDGQSALDQLVAGGDLLQSLDDENGVGDLATEEASGGAVTAGQPQVTGDSTTRSAAAPVLRVDTTSAVAPVSTSEVVPVVPVQQAQVSSPITSQSTTLLEASDLDAAFVAAGAQGKSSFNDAAGLMSLKNKLSDVFAQGQAAAAAKNGQQFSAYIVGIVKLAAQVVDPSDDVKLTFVAALQQAMSLLAFGGEAAKFADINSFDNLLEVVTYLKSGVLASQASALSVMESQLNSWLQSH